MSRTPWILVLGAAGAGFLAGVATTAALTPRPAAAPEPLPAYHWEVVVDFDPGLGTPAVARHEGTAGKSARSVYTFRSRDDAAAASSAAFDAAMAVHRKALEGRVEP